MRKFLRSNDNNRNNGNGFRVQGLGFIGAINNSNRNNKT